MLSEHIASRSVAFLWKEDRCQVFIDKDIDDHPLMSVKNVTLRLIGLVGLIPNDNDRLTLDEDHQFHLIRNDDSLDVELVRMSEN